MEEKELLEKTLACLEHGRKELSDIDLEISKKALPALDEIIDHINAPLMIMVMGEFSSGKSTFINAMVGQEVTAVNATPTTAVITKLCYGAEDRIIVHFIDGREEEFETGSFAQLTAKTGITGEDRTHASIEYVERRLPLEMLKYVTIIDSPGLNDINEQHSDTTKKFVHNSDTVLWMFSALQPGSKTEIEAMELLSPRLKPIAIVNKMDEIDEEEDDPEEFLWLFILLVFPVAFWYLFPSFLFPMKIHRCSGFGRSEGNRTSYVVPPFECKKASPQQNVR